MNQPRNIKFGHVGTPRMYILYICRWGDFDILQKEAIGVSTSKEVLEAEAQRLDSLRKVGIDGDPSNNGWNFYHEVSEKGVKVYG